MDVKLESNDGTARHASQHIQDLGKQRERVYRACELCRKKKRKVRPYFMALAILT